MDRARVYLKRGLLALGLLIVPSLLLAQGPYSAQIQQALQAFVQQAHTWTATQTFDDVTVTGTCTGCGGGGTGNVSAAGTLTQYAVVLGDGSTNVAVVSGLGSSGNVLTSNGAGAAPTFQAPSSSGGLVLLEQHTASSSASLNFTAFISSTYDQYLFELIGVLPETDNVDLLSRVGTGAGPSWDSGSNYYWFYSGQTLLGGITGQGNPGTSFKLAPNIENSVTGVGGDFTLYNPQGTGGGRKVVAWNTVANFSDGNVGRLSGGAIWNAATALTGVEYFYSSGNIASGTIRVYGLAK